MQFTTTALTLLAAAAMVQASCVPIITCGMKRDVSYSARAVKAATPSGDDFSKAFAACLKKDQADISPVTPTGATSFIIHGKDGKNDFHDCSSLVRIYQAHGMHNGALVANSDGTFKFTPTSEDLPGWQAAVESGKTTVQNGKASRDLLDAEE